VFQLRPQVLAQVMQIRIRPTVASFDRVVGQVVEFLHVSRDRAGASNVGHLLKLRER
jgi:hypothetical protein